MQILEVEGSLPPIPQLLKPNLLFLGPLEFNSTRLAQEDRVVMGWKLPCVSPLALYSLSQPSMEALYKCLSRCVLRENRVWGIRNKWGTVSRASLFR